MVQTAAKRLIASVSPFAVAVVLVNKDGSLCITTRNSSRKGKNLKNFVFLCYFLQLWYMISTLEEWL